MRPFTCTLQTNERTSYRYVSHTRREPNIIAFEYHRFPRVSHWTNGRDLFCTAQSPKYNLTYSSLRLQISRRFSFNRFLLPAGLPRDIRRFFPRRYYRHKKKKKKHTHSFSIHITFFSKISFKKFTPRGWKNFLSVLFFFKLCSTQQSRLGACIGRERRTETKKRL